MRVVYLHQYFNSPSMAGSTRSYELARRLVRRGHEVHMITSDRAPSAPRSVWRQSLEAGITVHWTPVAYDNAMGYRERMGAFLKFSRRAAGKAASIPADIVFATSTPLTIALPASYAARRQQIPMVLEVRDLWPEVPIAIGALGSRIERQSARWLERFAYREAAHVIALSPAMREGVCRSGYPERRITVIPNFPTVDVDAQSASGDQMRRGHEWLGNRPLVIYAGTIGKSYGVSYLVDLAAAVLRIDSRMRFAVIGDGAELKNVTAYAQACGVLNRNLFILPAVPKADMAAWISAADVATSLFIDLKELWASSANKFFEALGAGVPIAINYGGWQAELIEQTGSGLILAPRDPVSAAHMLVAALSDPAWLSSAGRAAHKLARQCFDPNRLAARLEDVLLEACGRLPAAEDEAGP